MLCIYSSIGFNGAADMRKHFEGENGEAKGKIFVEQGIVFSQQWTHRIDAWGNTEDASHPPWSWGWNSQWDSV